MSDLKALIVTQYFWPENFRINDIACGLSESGLEVDVLTGKPNYPSGKLFPGYSIWGNWREDFQGNCVYRIPMLPRGRNSLRLVLNYVSFILSSLLFAPWLLRGKKYDVIFVYAPSPIFQALSAIFLGWLKGIPVIIWVQDLWPQSYQQLGT